MPAEPANVAFDLLWAADVILLLHMLFVCFVLGGLVLIICGGVCGWSWVRNPWFRLAHIMAIGLVVIQSWLGVICPLTTWEMALRTQAGGAGYEGSFIGYWLGRILYYQAPPWAFVVAYTAFGMLVLMCWLRIRPRSFGEGKNDR
jgi:hypothetical protein